MPETTYHLQSLALALVCVSSVTFLCLAPALMRFADEFRESMRSWILGTACVVAADVIFFLGVEFAFADTVLTALAGIGVSEWIHSLRRYNGQAPRAWWPWVVVAIGSALSLATTSYPASVLITSSVFALLYGGAAREASGIHTPEKSIGRTLLVLVFSTIVLVMLGRLGLLAAGLRSGAPPGFTSPPRALMFIFASIGPIAGSFAFVLACGERLGDRLFRWSLIDSLTEIPNRRAFLDALDRALWASRRRSDPVAVLIVDVDNLKAINDSAGHGAGDLALVEVARRLTAASRTEDVVGRYGGDEFAVVVPGADLEAAKEVAERLRSIISSSPIVVEDRLFELTVSVGATVSAAGFDDSASDLIARADRLLYQAKTEGRDQVVVAQSADLDELESSPR